MPVPPARPPVTGRTDGPGPDRSRPPRLHHPRTRTRPAGRAHLRHDAPPHVRAPRPGPRPRDPLHRHRPLLRPRRGVPLQLAGQPQAPAEPARPQQVGTHTYTGSWKTRAPVPEVKDHGIHAYDRQVAETRSRLGGRLDLYQVHSVTPDSPALTDAALHRRLAALATAGVTVGLTTSGPGQRDAIRAAPELAVDGQPLFRSVQATLSLLETTAGPDLAEAHEAGLTVIVKEALANGRLAQRQPVQPSSRTSPRPPGRTRAFGRCGEGACRALRRGEINTERDCPVTASGPRRRRRRQSGPASPPVSGRRQVRRVLDR